MQKRAEAALSRFLCPISHHLVLYPVFLEDGHVYEDASLATWLADNDTAPMSRKRLRSDPLQADIIRNVIADLIPLLGKDSALHEEASEWRERAEERRGERDEDGGYDDV